MTGGPVGVGLGAAAATILAIRRRALVAERIRDPAIRCEVLTALGPKAMLKKIVSNGFLFAIGIRFIELLANFPGSLPMGVGQMLNRCLRYHFRVLL